MATKSLVFVWIFMFCFKFYFACLCQPHTDEYQFCTADFVFEAAPTKLEVIRIDDSAQPGHHEYTLNITKIFKSALNENEVSENHTYLAVTAPHEAICGVKMKIDGTNYLIAGKKSTYADKAVYLDICHWAKSWKSVDEKLKEKLESGGFNCTNF